MNTGPRSCPRQSLVRIIAQAMLVLLAMEAGIAQPDWAPAYGKSDRFPDSVYLTGFGVALKSAGDGQSDFRERAFATARRNLAEHVRISLQNTLVSRQEESNEVLFQYFNATSQAISALEIEGLQSESYYDTSAQAMYVLAYVRRTDLEHTYTRKVTSLRTKLNDSFQTGRRLGLAGDRDRALRALTSCYPLLRELEQSEGVLYALNEGNAASHGTPGSSNVVAPQQIDEAIRALLSLPVTSIDDAARVVAVLLKEQLGLGAHHVIVEPLTFEESHAASPFSQFFRQMLENQLTQVAGWEVSAAEGAMPGIADSIAVVVGSYWERTRDVKAMLSVYRIGGSHSIAGANVTIPIEVVRASGLRTKPENLTPTLADQKDFMREDPLPVGLELDVWTNKGALNPVFMIGERMTINVRLNAPAYVRCVYHLADGRRALLLDNMYLGIADVNRPFRIPAEFECAAPFGAEVLQVFARSEPFEKLATKVVDGYEIISDSLDKILTVTRGMVRVLSHCMQAERRIVVTTVKQ